MLEQTKLLHYVIETFENEISYRSNIIYNNTMADKRGITPLKEKSITLLKSEIHDYENKINNIKEMNCADLRDMIRVHFR